MTAKFDVLGSGIALADETGAIRLILAGTMRLPLPRSVCLTGVHGVMESLRDPEVRRAHNSADLVLPDGMPLVWLGRIKGHKDIGRVYGPDLMLELLKLSADKGYTNFFYGGKEGVAEELKRKMEERFPGLKVTGTHCPPFSPLTEQEESEVLSRINELKPDFLWIGLSTPKQELLMARWKEKGIKAKVMLGVGAAFDFHTGRVKQAPKWVRKIGMEWFFRLCMEPRRLAGRYLRNNPAFLWHVFLQLTGLRKY